MARAPDARTVVIPLVGTTIQTVTGRPNVVLSVDADAVVVGTERSPVGAPVPLALLQDGLDALYEQGAVTVDVETLGHRSAFIGAV